MRKIFSTMATYYFLIGIIIFSSLDMNKVEVGRLNYLKDVGDYPVLYVTGRAAFDKIQFRYAKKYYQTILTTFSSYAKDGADNGTTIMSRTYSMIALCDHYLGNNKEAIKLFKKALLIEPKHFWINYNLGVVYFETGDYRAALEYLNRCLLLNPDDLIASMDLDYWTYWKNEDAQRYKDLCSMQFIEVLKNSYKLSILAFERLGLHKAERKLSLTAIDKRLANHDPFYTYHARLTSRKIEPDQEIFNLMFNPSLSFLHLGQEKMFTKSQQEAIKSKLNKE